MNYSYSKNAIYSIFVAISFFIYNFILLKNGHFHEDAYILFIYVENFVNGYGITYFPGGEHIEGATDFLWLILLSLLNKVGFNVGTSAVLLNSIGVFLITFLLNRHIMKNNDLLILTIFSFLWIFSYQLIAAVGGFSVFLYMALILLNFVLIQEKKYYLFTPYISIAIALFRPDGVIIAIGFTIIGIIESYKSNELKLYFKHLILPIIIGIIYFVWRYNYFNNLLPLPLYVKSASKGLNGLGTNYKWIVKSLYILLPLIVLVYLTKEIKKYLYFSLPIILLFLALLTATQSQNVGFRFQAPIYIVIYYILVVLIIKYFKNENLKNQKLFSFLIIYIIFLVVFSLKQFYSTTKSITKFNYINQFPLALNKVLPENITIALTEAGRIAYWNQNKNLKIIDLVGLNTVYPAKNKVTMNYLNDLSPDLIMYHQASLINKRLYSEFKTYVSILNRNDKMNFNSIKLNTNDKVQIASLEFTNYLNNHFDDYDIFLVDYKENKTYSHIYAIKKSLNLRNQIFNLLNNSFITNTKMSYYDMIKIRDEN